MNGDAQQWTEVVRFDQVIGVVESFIETKINFMR